MCGAGPRAAVTHSDAWDFRASPRGPFRNVRGGSGGRFVCFFSVTEVSLLSRYRAVNGLPVPEAEMSLDDVKLQLHDCHPGPLSCVASVLDRDSGRGARLGLAGHAWAQAADGGGWKRRASPTHSPRHRHRRSRSASLCVFRRRQKTRLLARTTGCGGLGSGPMRRAQGRGRVQPNHSPPGLCGRKDWRSL